MGLGWYRVFLIQTLTALRQRIRTGRSHDGHLLPPDQIQAFRVAEAQILLSLTELAAPDGARA